MLCVLKQKSRGTLSPPGFYFSCQFLLQSFCKLWQREPEPFIAQLEARHQPAEKTGLRTHLLRSRSAFLSRRAVLRNVLRNMVDAAVDSAYTQRLPF